jgi:protease-4
MRNFIKYTFASFLGVFLALLLLILVGVGIVSAVLSTKPDEVKLKPHTVLQLDLSTPITDRTVDSPFETMSLTAMDFNGTLGLFDILENLKKAENDPNIEGVLIKLDLVSPGISTIVEIRDAILKFKESGKFVIAYGDYYTQAGYYLATAADKIYLNPEGVFEFKGMRSEVMFYTGALEKLGVEVQVLRYGKFKAAVEPFLQKEMSAANKEQTRTYLNAIWSHILEGISSERNINTEKLNELADNLIVRSPKSALENGFVDGLFYMDQLHDELNSLTSRDKNSKIQMIGMKKYINVPSSNKKDYTSDRIAVIFATGTIGMNQESSSSIGGHPMAKTIREARKDKKVKAIVLRINSGGGSAMASDIMWREVMLTKKVKPIIASMGDYAASGGYYMAMGCDTIVAQPTTVTGSIGIFGILFNAQELLNNKLGLTFDGVASHKYANSPSLTREMSDAEKMMIQNSVNRGYESFTSKAAQGRNMRIEDLKAIASGRVWTGTQAKANGLVDVLGGLDDAIKIAAKKVNLKDGSYRVNYSPKAKSDFQKIIEDISGDKEDATIKAYLGDLAPYANEIKNLQKMDRLQARMPFIMTVK